MTFIQFKLNEMSSRNEHHEFEEIATRIARKRISSNLLIATGPVSSGGDQQRDAETYTTRIPDELPHSAGFSASASTKPVVVACTVQKGGLKKKVLDDLTGICAPEADAVAHVAFFSVHSIAEGITHELKQIARETYAITVDIFCGADIATLLAEPDLVWVARHYLDLPSSMVPPPEGDSSPLWYADLLESLRRNRGPVVLTPATQGEITRGLRYAIWDKTANADLPEWLDFMGTFLTHTHAGMDTELVFRACYEMAVARFRGMGIADGIEDLIRRAIDYAYGSDHANIVEDALTLAAYWGGMWSTGVGKADPTEISERLSLLRSHVARMRDTTDPTVYPVRAATLTGALAYSHLMPEWLKVEQKLGKPQPVDRAPLAGVELGGVEVDITGMAEVFNISAAMEHLDQLVELLPRARAYSARQLATVFNLFAPLAVDHPSYTKVRDGLDSTIASVEGDAALAGRCRNRAVAFMKADKPLEALTELHKAKVNWFNGDTLYGALLMMRAIASIYDDLGLTYAAKMYACSAAAIADAHSDTETKKHLPTAILEAARYAQNVGNWADAAGLTELAVMAHHYYLPDSDDFEKYPALNEALMTEALEVAAVRKYWPELEPIIEQAHTHTPWFAMVGEIIEGAGNDGFAMSEDTFQEGAAQQLTGPVFGDLGPTRIIDFTALGVRWVFTFDNERTSVLGAEGLCGTFQVFLADIATRDPVLIKSTVRINVEVGGDDGYETDSFTVDLSSPEPAVTIRLPAHILSDQPNSAVAASRAFQLLDVVNARPSSDLLDLMEPMFIDGLSHKLFAGRPYEEAAGLLSPEHYQRCAAASRPASSAQFKPTEATPLTATAKPGPDYDHKEALQAIHERYEVGFTTLRYTYRRILADENSRATIERLRGAGWLDWQILITLSNLVFNWRIKKSGTTLDLNNPSKVRSLAMRPETPDSPEVPLEIFCDSAAVEMSAQVSMAAVASRWKLRGRTEVRNEGALRELLTRRYQWSVDDVPHRDILNSIDERGNLIPFVELRPAD
ncbi:hypothetical protein [Nocardia spumae]|uniref:hypothetical protein n=1 Tax=Nocardia spumae TaxID=2887190 RepID=UPI001D138B02|nr:hypothetical protein [Nocardia spumae]